MTNANDARRAHDLLDELDARAELSQEQEKLLRSFLPERPKKVTLLGLCNRVHDAWLETGANQWHREGEYLDNFLLDLRDDLTRLLHEPAPTAPALPAGMRLAEHEKYGRVVVSPCTAGKSENYLIFILDSSNSDGAGCVYEHYGNLTFIDEDPTHPEFLETEADYRDAPEGTIVARSGQIPWVKESRKQWSCISDDVVNCSMAQNKPRQILRWGWGK